MQRLGQIYNHLSGEPASALASLQAKHPDDVVVVMAVRSPLCKSGKGGFKDMRATIAKLPCDPALVEDICVGVVQGSGNAYLARASAIAAGFPVTTSVQSINRFCSSGLMAISVVANQIRNGEIDCGLAMGVENLSQRTLPEVMSDEIMAHPVAKDCSMPMGWTSENVAEEFEIPRTKMDEYASRSHNRADRANRTGLFAQEIVPLEALRREPGAAPGAPRQKVLVTEDDGIRSGTTPESLAKITDGAATALLMRRSKAESLGLPILGKHVNTVVAGLAPRIMGIGPYYAIPKVLEKCGITIADVDLFEINEAFASMYVFCVERLGLDIEKVNVNGGAIGLGHPFGCTGVRQLVTGLSELRRRGGKILVTSMCIGTGQGAAAVFVAE